MRVHRALVIGALVCFIACAAAAANAPGATTQAEKDALLRRRATDADAVVTLNEALMTAWAARRAAGWLASWPAERPGSVDLGGVLALDQRLQNLQDRFTTLYRAHFGAQEDRKGRPVPLTPAEQRLASNPDARAAARQRLAADYAGARNACRKLLQSARLSLAKLQTAARRNPAVPRFAPTPLFVRKPSARLRPDGTSTGIILGFAKASFYGESPATDPLDLDYQALHYEVFDRAYSPPPSVVAGQHGRQVQIVVPCAVHGATYCPADWFMQHSSEAISRPSAPRQYRGENLWPLDFYNPAVRSMLDGYLKEVGRRYRGDRNVLTFTTGGESELNEGEDGPWGQWPTGGRTPSAVAAFRAYLQQKFGAIEKLNQAWRASYPGFDAIDPPPDINAGPEPGRSALLAALASGESTPLYYEFNRFLKDSYADYLAWCYRILKAADPGHPISLSPSYGSLDGYLCTGRDSFRWAESACDLYGNESSEPLDEVFSYSIQRALNRTTGIFEYYWNTPETWSNPPEEIARAAAIRNLWRLVGWGRTVIGLFGESDTCGGGSYNNLTVFENGYNLLRRAAGAIGPLKRQLRSMEDVWLHAPVVEPRIAMLKPSASQICAWPWEAVTTVTQQVHDLLYSRNYHYAFVPEEYVVSGRDSLSGYRVVILPYATHFPAGLTEKLLAWVKGGGMLVLAGIAGGFDQCGFRDGKLMQALFGQLEYRPWGDLSWKITVQKLRPGVHIVGSYAENFLGGYGQGRALMAANANDVRPGGAMAAIFCRLVDSAAPRAVWADGSPLEMVLRQDGGGFHLVLINPDSRLEARSAIRLSGRYRLAVDRGVPGGFPVPLRKQGLGQAFDISLAPGEGTMIELYR